MSRRLVRLTPAEARADAALLMAGRLRQAEDILWGAIGVLVILGTLLDNAPVVASAAIPLAGALVACVLRWRAERIGGGRS